MQMRFHPKKCKVMHLGSKNNNSEYFMHAEDGNLHKLEETELEKDLGVNTDSKLKFTDHCNIKVNSATKVLRYIRYTFSYIDEQMFLLLYKALVRPHLEYASCIWQPYLKYNIDSIEHVQRRATKMIPSLRNLSYTERLEKLNLETLQYRRTRADLLETFRILNNIHTLDQSCHCSQCPGKMMFSPSLNSSTRGHSKKLQIQEATGIRKHFLSTRVAGRWNRLSEETVAAPNINIFKSRLAKELQNKFDFKFSY
jgi:hypothetical protein